MAGEDSTVAVLDGLQVVEIATGIAGPLAGMFLSDFGAEVVKVEPASGDPERRSAGFAMWNRGKKSVVVEPDDQQRCAWLGELIRGADVCIVSTVASLAEYGLSAEGIRRTNPGLVLLEMPPYSTTTPWLGGHESHGLLAAYSGLSARQTSYAGGPVEVVIPQFLMVQGLWAAVCAVAALIEREQSGTGQQVTVSAINAVTLAAAGLLTTYAGSPTPDTAIGTAGRHPTYTRFEARDGKWLVPGALGAKFETAFLETVGLGWTLADEDLGGMGGVAGLLDQRNFSWISELVIAAIRTRDADEWLKIFHDKGIACAPVLDPQEWLEQPQVTATGLRVEVDDPERGTVTMPGVPLCLTRAPGVVAGAAPLLGADNSTVQPRTPRPYPTASAPRMAAGPLSGLRIADLGTFIAGPYTGMLLAELGADVVKVEPPPHGDPYRATGFTYNRGLRSLAIDVRSPDGLNAFQQLVAASDVVVNSLRPGAARRLSIDHADLTEYRPDIISLGISAFGEQGPLAAELGLDYVIQGVSGMMALQGGDDEPIVNSVAVIDCTTAAFGALAVVLALFDRLRTGQGQHVSCSLAGSATYLQAGHLVHYDGRLAPPVGDRDFRGPAPLDRFYEVADGWIRVQATDPDRIGVTDLSAAGIEVDSQEFAADPTAALGACLALLSSCEAIRRLEQVGIPSVPSRQISEAQADETLLADEFVHIRPARGDTTPILTPGRYAGFSRTQRRGPMPVPGLGEHSLAVLAEVGLPDDEITRLIESGVVIAGGPMPERLAPLYR